MSKPAVAAIISDVVASPTGFEPVGKTSISADAADGIPANSADPEPKTIASVCARLGDLRAEYPAGSPLEKWPHLHAVEDLELREQESRSLPRLVAEWRAMRAAGVMAGSQCRRVAELRGVLLAAGCWQIVYE